MNVDCVQRSPCTVVSTGVPIPQSSGVGRSVPVELGVGGKNPLLSPVDI